MVELIIVEDDESTAGTLADYVRRYGNETGLGFSVTRFADADAMLARYPSTTQLVFMDIQLPGTNGMEAAHRLRLADPRVTLVFITSLGQYAIEGYRVNAVDYLVKPVAYPVFRAKMTRIMREVRRHAAEEGDSILVACLEGRQVIPLARLAYVEVRNHVLTFHTTEGTLHAYGILGAMAAELGPRGFVEVNAHCLVNRRHVGRMTASAVELHDGTTLTVSRTRRREARQALAAPAERA